MLRRRGRKGKRKTITDDQQPTNTSSSSTVKRSRTKDFFAKNEAASGYFSQKKCVTWFEKYSTGNKLEVIGPTGVETLCQDLGVEPDNVSLLVLAWKMGAQQMGYFSLQEWLQGLTELQCDSLSKLKEKLGYLHSLLLDGCSFSSIYRYAFDFSRDKAQKSLDIDTAKAMLGLLLGKRWTLLDSFLLFLDQSRYRVLNKDHWSTVLEFSRAVDTDLKNYDVDGAWPLMLDVFVEWLKISRGDANLV